MGHCFSRVSFLRFPFQGCCRVFREWGSTGEESCSPVNAFRCAFRLLSLWMLSPDCCKKKANAEESDQHVEFAGGNVHLVTTKEIWDQKISEASRNGKIVLANFSATWCGPCRMIAPFYNELSEKYPSIMFLLIDVDELTDFSTSWDIKATPTFFFLRDGQQLDKLVGANKPELQKKITAIADSVSV